MTRRIRGGVSASRKHAKGMQIRQQRLAIDPLWRALGDPVDRVYKKFVKEDLGQIVGIKLTEQQVLRIGWYLSTAEGCTQATRNVESLHELLLLCQRTSLALQSSEAIDEQLSYRLAGGLIAFAIVDSGKTPGKNANWIVGATIFMIRHLQQVGILQWVEPSFHNLVRYRKYLSNEETQVLFADVLSIVAREHRNSKEALSILQHVEYLVENPFTKVSPQRQASRLLNLANCYRDQNECERASVYYQRAERLAASHVKELLGIIYYQMAHLSFSEGDFPKTHEYLEKARLANMALSGLPSSSAYYSSLLAQLLIQEGKMLAAAQEVSRSLSSLPDKPVYQEDFLHFMLLAQISRPLHLTAAREWAARIAVVANYLSGMSKETGLAYTELAHAMSSMLRGAEAGYWYQRAKMIVQRTDGHIYNPSILGSIGFDMFMAGLHELSMRYLQDSVAASEKNKPTLATALAQLALVTALTAPDISLASANRFEELKREEELSYADEKQEIFLIARDILLSSPDYLLQWPKRFRWGTGRIMRKELAPLQRLLDIHGESVGRNARLLSAGHMIIRGTFYLQFCARGYLTLLREYAQLPSHIVLEWVFSRGTSASLQNRIALEWITNPSAISQNSRQMRFKEKWLALLPEMRAVMMRYFFLQEAMSAGQHKFPIDLRVERNILAENYLIWRKQLGVLNDLLAGYEVAGASGSPRDEAEQALLDAYGRHPTVHEALKDAWASHLNREERTRILNKARFPMVWGMNVLSRLKSKHPDSNTDKFLTEKLYQPLQQMLETIDRSPPFLAEYIQGYNEGYWIIIDLKQLPRKSASFLPHYLKEAMNYVSGRLMVSTPEIRDLLGCVSIHKVSISRAEAENIMYKVERHLRRQEDPDVSANKVIDLGIKVQALCKPVLDLIPCGTELWASFSPPWSSIPLEQLAVTDNGDALLDCYSIIRRDRFNYWLENAAPAPLLDHGTHTLAAIFGEPGETDLGGYGRKEAQEVADMLGVTSTLGAACTRETFRNTVIGKSIIHIAAHAVGFKNIGDYQALELSDGYLIGQELAALDLCSCRLAVLSTCISDTGQYRGVVPIETLAGYMIEAGVQTVLASKSIISNRRSAQSILLFYQEILKGKFVAEAAVIAFGKEQRIEQGVAVFPWVLIGRNQRIF